MFAHYGRTETSFVCAAKASLEGFDVVFSRGWACEEQSTFPRELVEEEFILLFEVGSDGGLTGRELTLFVEEVQGDFVYFDVVLDASPDSYWATWTGEDKEVFNDASK